jgi:hypothetical protein
MKPYLLLLLAGCVLFACLTGCDGVEESVRLLNEIEYFGRPGNRNNSDISEFLDCSIIPENSRGSLSVLGYKVGVTTYQKMIRTLEYDEIFWQYYYGHLVFTQEEDSMDDCCWGRIHTCFLDGRLSAIQGCDLDEFPETIEGFVEEFGVPDVVTWAGIKEARTVVWVEHGLIGCFLEFDGKNCMIFLIPPMELSEFEGSWLSKRIQYTPDYYLTKNGLLNPLIPEDPWRIIPGD